MQEWIKCLHCERKVRVTTFGRYEFHRYPMVKGWQELKRPVCPMSRTAVNHDDTTPPQETNDE